MSLFQDIERKPLPPDYHHPLSASKKRWLVCPASASIPDSGYTNPEAEFGTLVHHYAERMSRGLLPAEINVNKEAFNAAQKYLDAINPFLADCDEVVTEYRVYLDKIPVMLWPTLSGTADKIGVKEFGPLKVADLKTGFIDVEVEDNDQLDFYALGAYWALKPEVQATITHIEEFIVQVNGRVGVEVKRTTKSVADLLAWAEKATDAVAKAEMMPDVFVAGEHCAKTYCPHMLNCQASRQYLHDSIGTDITELDPEDAPEAIEELERMLDCVPKVEAWCKAVKERGLQLALTTPEAFNHYKVVASFGQYKFVDEAAFIAKAREQGVSDLIFEERKLKSKTQLALIPFVKEILEPEMFFRPSSGHSLKRF